jgi:hypothetical protein
MHIVCGSERRRQLVKDSDVLNAIDYLEVIPPKTAGQLPLLLVKFFKPLSGIGKEQVIIEGGNRIRNIKVTWAQRTDAITEQLRDDEREAISEIIEENQRQKFLAIRPNVDGDFSVYTLRLIQDPDNKELLPEGFDPILSKIDFSFKVTCPTDFDCRQEIRCITREPENPVIDYIAKDYASFRRLILDRLSAIAPEWKERNPADMGTMLVELLAYVGDYLSYSQDAVATEAYLGTARNRISVKRHARLLNYFMHEGCNARALVCFELKSKDHNGVKVPEKTKLLTGTMDQDMIVDEADFEDALREEAQVFETMHEIELHFAHNEIQFYTWGEPDCCLPKGATNATLEDIDSSLRLNVGDLLVFEEIRSPTTGVKHDRDPLHRHYVRLSKVERKIDPLNGTKVVDIAWDPEDALPFPLCLSEVLDPEKKEEEEEEEGPKPVSIARGNVVLADHGFTLPKEELVKSSLEHKFRPRLPNKPLTFKGPLKPLLPASRAFNYNVWDAEPDIHLLESEGNGEENMRTWAPRRDLLSSGKFAREFVVEMENDGTTQIRFGDDKNGMNPESSLDRRKLYALYRIGNGSEGNVGAEAISRIKDEPFANGIAKIRNPLPATGGKDREKLDEVKQNAPQAFRIQERAVTEADYEEVLKRHSEVQRAKAAIRWTGSWYTVFVTVDRFGGMKADDYSFRNDISNFLNKYRLAGYDIEIDEPLYVPLEVKIRVCADRNHFREEVKKALLEAFSSRELPDKRRGFFHPDNFTFGQPVFVSKVYEHAMKVDGVNSVMVEKFGRLGSKDNQDLEKGIIGVGTFEIARLDNDPNYPERGKIEIVVEGGR